MTRSNGLIWPDCGSAPVAAWQFRQSVDAPAFWRVMSSISLGQPFKDLDFDPGTITVHDGKGGKHRVVPLPMALEGRLKDYLAAANEKHRQDLVVGAGEVHMPESLTRKYPNSPAE